MDSFFLPPKKKRCCGGAGWIYTPENINHRGNSVETHSLIQGSCTAGSVTKSVGAKGVKMWRPIDVYSLSGSTDNHPENL
jgi:hypothetical protein